jgi:hypothetical protein
MKIKTIYASAHIDKGSRHILEKLGCKQKKRVYGIKFRVLFDKLKIKQ